VNPTFAHHAAVGDENDRHMDVFVGVKADYGEKRLGPLDQAHIRSRASPAGRPDQARSTNHLEDSS
jgi:hypothetical protein